MWNKIKQRKHHIISWLLMLLAISELGINMELSWSKFFLVLVVLVTIDYYSWARKND